MPSTGRRANGILTWRNTFLAAVMSTLLVGLVTLVYFLNAARSQKGLPEPGGLFRPNHTISFPFGHNQHRWVNASRDGRCPAHFVRCAQGSPHCVELERRCDGRVDCPRAEDEVGCACAFRMPASKFCDKYPDCFDSSDESFCSYCPLGAYNCGNGQCVPRDKVCDSEIDCDNFMDENFCFRLSNVPLSPVEDIEPHSSSPKSGYLLRNQKGRWFPVCANPHDLLQPSLASFACVSITANPMVSSTHRFRRFGRPPQASRDFLYHYQGNFLKLRGCLTNSGIFVSCSDVRCGFNPQQLVPKKPRGRIVGGELSEPGAWPWHAAIYKNGSYSCGATLISNRWLISAAHCFLNHKHNYYEVQLGMLRRRSFSPHQKTLPLDRVLPHPKFNIVTLEYDIALLRTARPLAFDFWIRPICLPTRSPTAEGALCTAIGWGDKGETEDDSDDLLEVRVPVTRACKRNADRWMCAGLAQGGRDACQGDSGGPLMCLREDGFSWYIAGVISGGTGCARPKTPGMYTRVVYYLDWIAKVVGSRPGRGEILPLRDCPGWRCPVLGGGNCLKRERVCDAHVDCYDAQDEANCTTWSM